MARVGAPAALIALALGGGAHLGATGADAAPARGERIAVVEDLGAGRAMIDGHHSPRPWARQTLGHLIERWGEPAKTRARGGGAGCIAVWHTPRAVAHLANLGWIPAGESACSPEYGRIQGIETAGPNWKTRRGLRVGARVAALRAAYPKAIPEPRSSKKIWLLRPYPALCFGDCGPGVHRSSGVLAVIRAGRVSSFTVRIMAAGD